jgi:hypothetical protein
MHSNNNTTAASNAASNNNFTNVTNKATRMTHQQRQILALRKVRHSNAAQVARECRKMALAAKRLIAIHKQMEREGRAIAGDGFKALHELPFMEVRRMAKRATPEGHYDSQVPTDEPGLVDIVVLADDIARWAGECAAEAEPPKLPSE